MNALRPDPEAIFGLLLGHARSCPRCWPYRSAGFTSPERLCESGRQLASDHAAAAIVTESRRNNSREAAR